MAVLNKDCWHKMMDDKIGNSLEPPAIDLTSCGDACSFCCDALSKYIMPISRPGLSLFLADVFINNSGGDLTPSLIVKKLTQYKNVGTSFYGRPRSTNPHSPKFVHTTILQLIASEMGILAFDEVTNDPRCLLGMIDAKPAYLDDGYWKNIYLV